MKRQQRTIGAIVNIPLENRNHTYGRILGEASFAIYDCITTDKIKQLEAITSCPILFIVAVYNDVITEGRWEKTGFVPLEQTLQKLPPKYIRDAINPDTFRIYENGQMRPASKEECIGLEVASVWEPNQVEERINDHYAGRTNIKLEKDIIK